MFKNIKTVGEYIGYTGMAFLAIMVVVGTVAIDIVIIAAMLKESKRRTRDNNEHSFFTGYVLGVMFSNHHHSSPSETIIKLFLSPITTLIAIALSVFLGVPQVGIALAIGWVVAASVVVLGLAISRLADIGIDYFEPEEPTMSDQAQSLTRSPTETPVAAAVLEVVAPREIPVATAVLEVVAPTETPVATAVVLEMPTEEMPVAPRHSNDQTNLSFFSGKPPREPSAPPLENYLAL